MQRCLFIFLLCLVSMEPALLAGFVPHCDFQLNPYGVFFEARQEELNRTLRGERRNPPPSVVVLTGRQGLGKEILARSSVNFISASVPSSSPLIFRVDLYSAANRNENVFVQDLKSQWERQASRWLAEHKAAVGMRRFLPGFISVENFVERLKNAESFAQFFDVIDALAFIHKTKVYAIVNNVQRCFMSFGDNKGLTPLLGLLEKPRKSLVSILLHADEKTHSTEYLHSLLDQLVPGKFKFLPVRSINQREIYEAVVANTYHRGLFPGVTYIQHLMGIASQEDKGIEQVMREISSLGPLPLSHSPFEWADVLLAREKISQRTRQLVYERAQDSLRSLVENIGQSFLAQRPFVLSVNGWGNRDALAQLTRLTGRAVQRVDATALVVSLSSARVHQLLESGEFAEFESYFYQAILVALGVPPKKPIRPLMENALLEFLRTHPQKLAILLPDVSEDKTLSLMGWLGFFGARLSERVSQFTEKRAALVIVQLVTHPEALTLASENIPEHILPWLDSVSRISIDDTDFRTFLFEVPPVNPP